VCVCVCVCLCLCVFVFVFVCVCVCVLHFIFKSKNSRLIMNGLFILFVCLLCIQLESTSELIFTASQICSPLFFILTVNCLMFEITLAILK